MNSQVGEVETSTQSDHGPELYPFVSFSRFVYWDRRVRSKLQFDSSSNSLLLVVFVESTGRVSSDFLSIQAVCPMIFFLYSGRFPNGFLAIQAVFPLIFLLFRPCFLWFSFYSGRVPYVFLSIQAVFPLTFFLFRQCSLWWYEHTGTAQIHFWGQEDGSASWCSMWRVSVVRSYYRVSWMMTVHHQHSIQPPAHPPISFKLTASSSIIATRKMRMIISRSYRPFYTKSWNALQSIHTGKQ